ncbi:hypothetical protein ACFFTM_06000 [Pseudoduganella plicata]|uniref:Integral membrane protein n=1 Tax=Pseudoduganella plicata TaxID=321984 RepID=A0A4P7BJI3_9BURK|nr:hypothetical protein [Pseudoduganella plicata]QBQ38600.1 hypothetical protein E1742_22300 [Pseudoduganella plicata]GGY83439.1 hypothetical protein GCM10007388_15580 [Pseudoduganella plicata]
MHTVAPSSLLKRALLLDAAGSGAIAVLQLMLPGPLHAALGLPPALLTGTGLFLLVYALALAVLARSGALWPALVRFVIAGNLGWVALSLLLPLTGAVTVTLPGALYIAAQAAAVLLFAGLEWRGLTRSLPDRVTRRGAMPAGRVL